MRLGSVLGDTGCVVIEPDCIGGFVITSDLRNLLDEAEEKYHGKVVLELSDVRVLDSVEGDDGDEWYRVNVLGQTYDAVAALGYIHNSLGNVAIRVPHPAYKHGIAYTKHSGVSLEEMDVSNVVITDIPTTDLLYGTIAAYNFCVFCNCCCG